MSGITCVAPGVKRMRGRSAQGVLLAFDVQFEQLISMLWCDCSYGS